MTYFAYGTLLDEDAMRRIAPSARSLGIHRLDGYRMEFGQCARQDATGCMLQANTDDVTYGILFDLKTDDMNKLDGAAVSGSKLWVHMPITLTDRAGNKVNSVTYTIPGNPPLIAPNDDYVRPILKGLDVLELPDAYVKSMKQIIRDAQQRE